MCSRELLVAVVDDDARFRAALVDSLCSLGYGASGFASAEEFIAANGDGSCDCLITDIHMPGMSGFDLGRLIAARRSEVPVIMITARAEAGLETRAVANGAAFVLTKPFATDALIACLERALKV
jgi:FixJ family two-component response regulator